MFVTQILNLPPNCLAVILKTFETRFVSNNLPLFPFDIQFPWSEAQLPLLFDNTCLQAPLVPPQPLHRPTYTIHTRLGSL